MQKLKTNIPQLDEMLKGGLDENSLSLLWIKPGLDGSIFAYQIADSISKTNDVLYVINSKNPKNVKEEMESYGFKTQKIAFIDSYSGLIGDKTTSKFAVQNPKDMKGFFDFVANAKKNYKKPFIIIDSLSTLMDLGEEKPETVLKLLQELNSVLCTFTAWDYPTSLLSRLKKEAGNIINITSVEKKLFIRNYFGITKSTSNVGKQQAVPYKVTKPGGIKIYIPKILVTGPFNAGKTSFIHSASNRAVSVDRLGTTIALDHGHVKYKDFAVDLFGTPGQQRFDPILKLLGGEALGVVIVVSATDPSTFPRASEMAKKANVNSLPYVIAANKSNLRGALTIEQIRVNMALPKDAKIISLEAQDLTKVQPGLPCQIKKQNIESVLNALFSKLLEGSI